MPKPLPEALKKPVTTIDEAYAWIKGLIEAELMFHFDDSPEDIICFADDQPLFSEEDAEIIGERLDEIYNIYEWGQQICPIGIALMLEGADGYTTYDIPEYQLQGEPTPSHKVVCFKRGDLIIADCYCAQGIDPSARFEVSEQGKVFGNFHLFEDAIAFAQDRA